MQYIVRTIIVAMICGVIVMPIDSAFSRDPVASNLTNLKSEAERGSAESQTKLGDYYLEKKNYREAISWYLKAANQGDGEAQHSLGLLYASGKGIEKNFQEALKWFVLASDQGHGDATHIAALLYAKGEGLSRPDIERARDLALLAAEQGSKDAQHDVGLMYMLGEGVSQSYLKAIQWWERAAGQGHGAAANNLGLTYDEGRGGAPKDPAAAIPWYLKAVEFGNEQAAFNLGFAYVQGEAIKQNNVLAYVFFQIATRLGNEDGPPSARRMEMVLTKNQIAEGRALANAWKVGMPVPTKSKTLPQ